MPPWSACAVDAERRLVLISLHRTIHPSRDKPARNASASSVGHCVASPSMHRRSAVPVGGFADGSSVREFGLAQLG
jgi:hypothetical protein